jgi:hypothetical protein
MRHSQPLLEALAGTAIAGAAIAAWATGWLTGNWTLGILAAVPTLMVVGSVWQPELSRTVSKAAIVVTEAGVAAGFIKCLVGGLVSVRLGHDRSMTRAQSGEGAWISTTAGIVVFCLLISLVLGRTPKEGRGRVLGACLGTAGGLVLAWYALDWMAPFFVAVPLLLGLGSLSIPLGIFPALFVPAFFGALLGAKMVSIFTGAAPSGPDGIRS